MELVLVSLASLLAGLVDSIVGGGGLILLPALWWGYGPPAVYKSPLEDFGSNIRQVGPAAIVLGLAFGGTTTRFVRSSLLEVLRQDYIRTAYAKGLRQRAVVVRHALRNAMLPVVTVVGLQLANLLSGTLTIEIIFGLPGIGRVMIDAINTRDYPTIQTVNLLVATSVVFINLIVDLTYGYLDPRTKVA